MIRFTHKFKCQAEDMGGHPACDNLAALQTIEDVDRRYYCLNHKTNRHVWKEEELEPIGTIRCEK